MPMLSYVKLLLLLHPQVVILFVKLAHLSILFQVMLLGRLHHRNLVNLVGYCAEKGQHMLIYVYMSKGSLASHLYSELLLYSSYINQLVSKWIPINIKSVQYSYSPLLSNMVWNFINLMSFHTSLRRAKMLLLIQAINMNRWAGIWEYILL